MRKLLICFDVDGTLIDDTTFIWQTLHDAIGTDPQERDEWATAFWNKEITYEQWAGHDIDMWQRKGVNRQQMITYIDDLKPMLGSQETLLALKTAGHDLGVISGSLDIALERAFPESIAFFEHIFLNRLIFDEDGVLQGIKATPFDIDHKADGLVEMSRRTNIPMSDTVFIGDNFNDVSVAKIAGLSLAFNCKSHELAAVSDHVISGKDLRSILPLIESFAGLSR